MTQALPSSQSNRPQQTGVLASDTIKEMINDGAILMAQDQQGNTIIAPRQIQPASLDLTLGKRAWRVRASFLPSNKRKVSERLQNNLEMHPINLENGAVFERGCVYLVELNERLALPSIVEGAANPKSSTGRIDVFVRLVTDYAAAFDHVKPGYHGPLYAEVSPRTFSILARTGSSLNQLRFKNGPCLLDDEAVHALHKNQALSDSNDIDVQGGLGVRVHLNGDDSEIVGYRARRHARLIDVDKPNSLDPDEYFQPITAPKDKFIILDPDEFYILASRESLTIPNHTAAEMTPISPGLGEFRVHYAGFFDPGFGMEKSSRGVLEVRSHDAPFVLEDGQLVARLVYEHMATIPKSVYGQNVKSNYQGQALKLSKHFRQGIAP